MDHLTDKEIKELARQKKNEYMRNWRKNNPKAVKDHQENYWKRVALKELKENQI